MSEWLTADELSRMIRIDRQTIYRMCKSKQIPYAKFGYTYRFDKEKILEWMNQNTNDPQ